MILDSSEFLLIVLSSPSGAGKTTLTNRLKEHFQDLQFSISHTTRPPRTTEIRGRDYHFVNRSEFEKLAEQNTFIEWAEVYGNLYGTSRDEIDRAQKIPGCRGLIFDIDYQGARRIKAQLSDVLGIFILPPSFQELEYRLKKRASETEELIQKRFAKAKLEIEHYALFDFILINHELERAFSDLCTIVQAERMRRFRQAQLAEALLHKGKIFP
ncbi:guanylate kinase [Pajaroellobacter abortibovis]|uniref:Guanylate kinase n=1 Tax=Pajaroellobacter abortibovis TaxID=1882918 RepID=A0A1L6MXD6_9BACT|nr:guanylate kinase [Pajaroellobacter abortibovis]APS00190.1 guanylate kinase [Pajaroellobacter abortibovis]